MTAFLVPPIPAQMWRDAGYAAEIQMVVGENVQQVFSLDEAAANGYPPGTIVMYDIEAETTPPKEVAHAKRSMKEFVTIAHAKGWKAMLAPARSVAKAQSGKPKLPGESDTDAFFRLGLGSVRTDYFLFQSQRLVCDTAEFAAAVKTESEVVRGKLVPELTLGWADSKCLWKNGDAGAIDLITKAYDSAHQYSDLWALWGAGADASPFFDHVRANP